MLANEWAYEREGVLVQQDKRAPSASGDHSTGTSKAINLLRKDTGLEFVAESMAMFSWDFKNIQEGLYNPPWDMTTPSHKQFNPVHVASG